MKACRCIIAGSRDFEDYISMEKITTRILNDFANLAGVPFEDIEIVEGGARGADRLGFLFSESLKLKHNSFPADWEKHGKSAGHIRNYDMAVYASESDFPILIAFWDGASKGTAGMISTAKRKGLYVVVVNTNTFQIQILN